MQNIDLKINSEIEVKSATPEMAKEYFDLVNSNRNYLKKTLPWIDNVKSVEGQFDYFNKFVNKSFYDKFLIFYNDKMVGEIYLQHYNLDRKEVEIAYWIDENYQGKGIVSRSLQKLINYIFSNFNINIIYLYVNVENIKSENLAKKLGFEFTGEVDKNHDNLYERYVDSKKYSLNKK